MREEPKRTETIVEGEDDRALFCERRTVVSFFAAEPRPESAAVDPNHHGSLHSRSERRSPHVQVETILGDAGSKRIDVIVRLMLHAVVAELARVPHSRPVCRGTRRAPAQIGDWWRGVGDSTEDEDARCRIDNALDGAVFGSGSGGVLLIAGEAGDCQGAQAGEPQS